MRADVTSVIHLSTSAELCTKYEQIAEILGLVIVNASNIEDVHWLATRLNKFFIVISDTNFLPSQINVEAPVICVSEEELDSLEQIFVQKSRYSRLS